MLKSSLTCALILAVLPLSLYANNYRKDNSLNLKKGKKGKSEIEDSAEGSLTRSNKSQLKSKKHLIAEREVRLASPLPGKFSGLHPQTQVKMKAALADMKKAGVCPTITSAYRSSAQQRAMYTCAHHHQCKLRHGIYSARKPGTSLHEAGLAVDLADVAAGRRHRRLTHDGKKMVKIMQRNGFKWRYGLRDPAHFEIDPQKVGFRNEKQAIFAAQLRREKQSRKSRKHKV